VTFNDYASHADFENQCSLCHQPLQASQAKLCEDCHKDIQTQIQDQKGTHGRVQNVEKCGSCHAEHKGRDFDPVQTALDQFDHSQTSFPLTGKHAEAACKDCHKNNQFGDARADCAACHAEPVSHKNMFGLNCAECHTQLAWKPASYNAHNFDHNKLGFSLVKHTSAYNGKPIACTDCHTGAVPAFDNQTCVRCHSANPPKDQPQETDFMSKHAASYGTDCMQCHDGTDRMRGFTHENVFVLDGKHAALACDSCHAGMKFHGTPVECSACHQEPDIHKGFFGLKCQYCHTTDAWRPALLHIHNFPLDHGGKGESSCATCHTQTYAVYTCYGCHDHSQGGIQKSHKKIKMPAGIELEQCTACHLDGKNPPTP
jgi:hypothetical protein